MKDYSNVGMDIFEEDEAIQDYLNPEFNRTIDFQCYLVNNAHVLTQEARENLLLIQVETECFKHYIGEIQKSLFNLSVTDIFNARLKYIPYRFVLLSDYFNDLLLNTKSNIGIAEEYSNRTLELKCLKIQESVLEKTIAYISDIQETFNDFYKVRDIFSEISNDYNILYSALVYSDIYKKVYKDSDLNESNYRDKLKELEQKISQIIDTMTIDALYENYKSKVEQSDKDMIIEVRNVMPFEVIKLYYYKAKLRERMIYDDRDNTHNIINRISHKKKKGLTEDDKEYLVNKINEWTNHSKENEEYLEKLQMDKEQRKAPKSMSEVFDMAILNVEINAAEKGIKNRKNDIKELKATLDKYFK